MFKEVAGKNKYSPVIIISNNETLRWRMECQLLPRRCYKICNSKLIFSYTGRLKPYKPIDLGAKPEKYIKTVATTIYDIQSQPHWHLFSCPGNFCYVRNVKIYFCSSCVIKAMPSYYIKSKMLS